MGENETPIDWRVIGETVPGATHLRAGVPNQDSILCLRQSSRGLPIVVSISDGHGSPKCFRSHRGSKFAVERSTWLVSEFLDAWRGKFDRAEIEKAIEALTARIVETWRAAVDADLQGDPFTAGEFERLEKQSGTPAKKLVEENPLLAYGATLLTVAVEENFVLYLQLGDGDILNISRTGEVTKPISEDARLLANETTSLCLPKAAADFRFSVQEVPPGDGGGAQMILLSTDGYLNSFSSEAGFFQAGTDILAMLEAEDGFDTVNENLKAWLEEATQMGSGDDCTVAIIYRNDFQKEHETEVTAAAELSRESSAPRSTVEGEAATPENLDDLTVTITFKKDKKTISKSMTASPSGEYVEKETE